MTKYLLDTCAAIWALLGDDEKLSVSMISLAFGDYQISLTFSDYLRGKED